VTSTAKRFTAELASTGMGGGRWVEVPFDAREAFGEARAPVTGTLNGLAFRGRLSVYGGHTYLGLRREIRDAAGIELGDPVEVVIERDDAPREVEVPPALAAALADDPEARAAFDALAFTHRNEYAAWVAGAKRDETRARRVERSLRMLREGVRHP
jgi:bifunctional DNA-binding transcriptional regulator/antitoxin component of YhaV-PrlF toxin-antitoxin module